MNVKKEDLQAAGEAMEGFRLRSFIAKRYSLAEVGNVYGDKIPREQLDAISDDMLKKELLRSKIVESLKKEPKSCKTLSEELKAPSYQVLRELVVLRRKGIIDIKEVKETSPIYAVL